MNSTERLMRYLDALEIKYDVYDPGTVYAQICIKNESDQEVFSSFQCINQDLIEVRDDGGFLRIEDCCKLGILVGACMTAEKALEYIVRWYFNKNDQPCDHKLVRCGTDNDTYICKACKARFYKEERPLRKEGS